MIEKLTWSVVPFNELTLIQLYDLLHLRSQVFVVEQNCVFLDPDLIDQTCYHVLGYQQRNLSAYSRIVPIGFGFGSPSIGRVVVAESSRKLGYGVELISKSIQSVEKFYGKCKIEISAQLYLRKFYESFGFIQQGSVYLEDGIEHVKMTRKYL